MDALWSEIIRQYEFDIVHDYQDGLAIRDSIRETRVALRREYIWGSEYGGNRQHRVFNKGGGDLILAISADTNIRAKLFVNTTLLDEFDMKEGQERFVVWDRYPVLLVAMPYTQVWLEVDREDVVIAALYGIVDDETVRSNDRRPFVSGPHESHGYFLTGDGVGWLQRQPPDAREAFIYLPDVREALLEREAERRRGAHESCASVKEELVARAWHSSELAQCLDVDEARELGLVGNDTQKDVSKGRTFDQRKWEAVMAGVEIEVPVP